MLERKLSCKALIADSEQTSACALLSVSLLIGLMANYFLGIWQADLIVGLIIAIFLFRKGLEWLKEARVGGTVFPDASLTHNIIFNEVGT